MVYTI